MYGETDKVAMPTVRAFMGTTKGSFCGLPEMSLAVLEQTAEAEVKPTQKKR